MKTGQVIIVSGPTACGKTQTSIELALLLQNQYGRSTEIINFDSLLFYSELNIGTAKPTIAERQGIPHHLIDVASIKNPLNAADYLKSADQLLKKIIGKNKIPLLVGGSGFYLRALIKGMYETPQTPESIKKQVQDLYQKEGITAITELLKIQDPDSLKRLHPNDHYRLTRALEFFLSSGQPISLEKERKQQENPYDFSVNQYPHWDFLHFYLDIPKEIHQKVIEKRTKQMFEDGLLEEVKNLLAQGFTGEEKPMQSIGYKETVSFLHSQIKTQEELVEQIVISTRQLAKSQRTFFAKVIPKEKINPLEETEKRNKILENFITC